MIFSNTALDDLVDELMEQEALEEKKEFGLKWIIPQGKFQLDLRF